MDKDFPDILRYIWRRQPGQFAFIAERRGGRWKDYPLSVEHNDFATILQGPDTDLFFTPLTFIEPHRSNEACAGARVLFADLDPVDPTTLSLPPSMSWETSPGSYQALWLLGDELGYSRFANLNRRLTLLTGADPGGWMGSKLLRVPGSTNHKYDPPRPGRLLSWDPGMVYWADDLEERFPIIPNRPLEGAGEPPEPIAQDKHAEYVRERWESLTLSGRSMLMRRRVPDRSLHIVRTINELLKTGMAPNTIYNMLWWQPYMKWRTDRHRPDQLWAEINRAKMRLVD